MIERLLLALMLLAAGIVLYRTMVRFQLNRVRLSAPQDPILQQLSPGVPAVLYFTTPTCIPCKTQQQPALARLLTELGDQAVQVLKIDATENPAAADRWGVLSAPTTFILDGSGRPREVNHGVADAEKLKRQILAVMQS